MAIAWAMLAAALAALGRQGRRAALMIFTAVSSHCVLFPATGKLGLHGFWSVAALITLVWYNNVAGAPPPDPDAAPLASIILFLLVVAWAYWIDTRRTRRPTAPGLPAS